LIRKIRKKRISKKMDFVDNYIKHSLIAFLLVFLLALIYSNPNSDFSFNFIYSFYFICWFLTLSVPSFIIPSFLSEPILWPKQNLPNPPRSPTLRLPNLGSANKMVEKLLPLSPKTSNTAKLKKISATVPLSGPPDVSFGTNIQSVQSSYWTIWMHIQMLQLSFLGTLLRLQRKKAISRRLPSQARVPHTN
jgi:hypothetical protein